MQDKRVATKIIYNNLLIIDVFQKATTKNPWQVILYCGVKFPLDIVANVCNKDLKKYSRSKYFYRWFKQLSSFSRIVVPGHLNIAAHSKNGTYLKIKTFPINILFKIMHMVFPITQQVLGNNNIQFPT